MAGHETTARREQSFRFKSSAAPIKVEPRLRRSDDVKGLAGQSGLLGWADQKLGRKAFFGGQSPSLSYLSLRDIDTRDCAAPASECTSKVSCSSPQIEDPLTRQGNS
jgi:hypothetical protein